jgi:hypothetical protein
VRAGFLEALAGDPRIGRLFASWRERVSAEARGQRAADLSDAVAFVRDALGLPWPWLCFALFDIFHRMMTLGIVDAAQAIQEWGPEEAHVHAPPFQLSFQTLDGESTVEARERLVALFVEALAQLADAERDAGVGVVARGRRARRDRSYLRAWGRGYYAARVQRPAASVSALARTYHVARRHTGQPADCCRREVRAAIATAGRLLGRAAYRFRAGGA